MRSTFRTLTIGWVITSLAGSVAGAQEPPAPSTQDLRVLVDQFPVPGSRLNEIAVTRPFLRGEEFRPFSGQLLVGLAISGVVQFRSSRGLARVVLVDDQLREHLVYETYPLMAGATSVQIRDACRETCLLPATFASTLKVELVDASLQLQSILLNQLTSRDLARTAGAAQVGQQSQKVKQAQEAEIIERLNRHIKASGKKWIAGETSISRLSFDEKRRLLPCAAPEADAVPNLQGAEYYTGGILEIGDPSDSSSGAATAASTLIDAFDWRSRHGANRAGSPYYDGDPAGGGWLTSIKTQLCGDCWAHSALGATEALVNLYFNQHLDVNLSEQELVSCAGAGGCSGGYPDLALAYVQRAGVVDESCFPESGIDESCELCPVPQERIQISGFNSINPFDGEENIKRRLIGSGPLPFGIISWWHALVLAGYETEPGTGDTVWILKNSWGPSWGEQGYGRVKVPLDNIYHAYFLLPGVLSLISPYSIDCSDRDGDGFFNWGLSPDAPLTCGNIRPVKDCDDSDPSVAILTEDGFCTALPDTTAPVITIAATPSTLWPPNGRLVPVTISGTIADTESGVDPAAATFAALDEYGQVESSGQVAVAPDGSYVFTVLLQALRLGFDVDGRRYTITVTARDQTGNSRSTANAVTVPHDMGRGNGPARKDR